jgi:hypothetical protein
MAKKKEQTPMEKLTQGYEKFIKGKELNENGREQFEKTVKKAATPKKLRGSK